MDEKNPTPRRDGYVKAKWEPMRLEPVGEDWDCTVKPLDQMTYDPPKGGDSNGG